VVVVDEMDIGIRPPGTGRPDVAPMEALARHYLLAAGRQAQLELRRATRVHLRDGEQYKVDGVVSQAVRFCTYLGWDKFDLKKQLQERASRSWSSTWSTAIRRGADDDPRRGVHGDAGKPGQLARRPRQEESSMAVVGVDLDHSRPRR